MKQRTDSPVEIGGNERSPDLTVRLDEGITLAGGEWQTPVEFEGSVGRTMYDVSNSKDGTVTVLLPSDNISAVPSQSLVRIKSRPLETGGDGRQYLGAVVQGPFAEPDGLRADAPIVVATTVRGAAFTPRYHGRVQVEVLGEEVDGSVVPPRFRPLPNSPVFVIQETETAEMLGLSGDIQIGLAVGFNDLKVHVPSDKKSVLPRHVGVLGTTGGGKSTTVSGQVHQFQKAGIATIIIDTEGEYTRIDRPADDKHMVRLLQTRGMAPAGISDLQVYHLTGRGTTAKPPTQTAAFKLDFATLSPYAAAEIMDLSEAQQDRFFKAYDTAKLILADLNIYPKKGTSEVREALELDEFESGYPRLTLSHLIDIAGFILAKLAAGEHDPYNGDFKGAKEKGQIKQRVNAVQTNHEISWKALLSKLWRLQRMGIFDNAGAKAISFGDLIQPGHVSVVDLSDTDSTLVNNLVIANILRGLQIEQDASYERAEKQGKAPTPVMIVIEEAHEFLSRDRIAKMENLFQQVARIARRGRKRWLGLMFVTQLPQHLPDEVLGLINNFVLHKITDANVISRLRRSIGRIDEGLWNRLPNLAPGQAVVSMANMTRPLLVAIDPTPCKLRMID
jgi:DNA helicase HerA-like ATPase